MESHVWALAVAAGAGGQEEGLCRPLLVHLLCAQPWAAAPSFPFLLSVHRPLPIWPFLGFLLWLPRTPAFPEPLGVCSREVAKDPPS